MNDQKPDRQDGVREALADKIGKDIACTRTYSMSEWAIIECALRCSVPPTTRDGAEGAGLPSIDDALHTSDVIASLQKRALALPKPAPSWPQDAPPLRTELLGPDGMGSASEADLMLAYGVDQPTPDAMRLKLGDIVRANETFPHFHEWRDAEMKVVSLRVDTEGNEWVSVIEGSPRHRGNGLYDSETTDIKADWLTPISAAPVPPADGASPLVVPRLPQDTLDRLAMLNVSKEEVYEVLKKHLPEDMIDGIWQEIKEAGK